ncbi:MAG: hypothetical protein H7X99_10790, partial [Saprospiraceae bacterium]|nr:hypothetical protein [Saprospiraceae bacterium]
MKSSQEDIELLEAYLKGRLDKVSVINVEARLAVEKKLSEDLSELNIITQGIRADGLDEKFRMLKEYEQSKYKNEDQEDRSDHKTKTLWWKWLLTLVIISLISYVGYYTLSGKEKKMPEAYKQLFAERFDSELILHKTMRAAVQTDGLSQEQRRAYELYSIQMFDDAIPLLDELWVIRKDTLALFYLGISKIGIGQ